MRPFGESIAIMLIVLTAPISMFAQAHQPKLIDVHVHYEGQPGYLQKLLVKLDKQDGLAFLLTTSNAYAKAQAFIRKYPDRFIGFCKFSFDVPDAVKKVDQCHAIGFLGLGEIESTGHNYDSPVYWPIYARAERYHMILLFHTGVEGRPDPQKPQNVGFDRERVTRLDLIARRFPGLILIGAHMGNPDYAEAAEIGRWDPNLYFDLSGSSLVKKRNDYTFFKSIFWWTGISGQNTPKSNANAFEKLVFGSDDFGPSPTEFDRALSRYHKMLDACDVPKNVQDMIFSGTMWKILQRQKEEMADSSQVPRGDLTYNAQ